MEIFLFSNSNICGVLAYLAWHVKRALPIIALMRSFILCHLSEHPRRNYNHGLISGHTTGIKRSLQIIVYFRKLEFIQ